MTSLETIDKMILPYRHLEPTPDRPTGVCSFQDSELNLLLEGQWLSSEDSTSGSSSGVRLVGPRSTGLNVTTLATSSTKRMPEIPELPTVDVVRVPTDLSLGDEYSSNVSTLIPLHPDSDMLHVSDP